MEDDVIKCIQRNFHEAYPYLKLQFYRHPHREGRLSNEAECLSPLLPVEEAAMFHTSGKINIDPGRTVAAVEHDFFRIMGLCVQVLRRSGNLWLETTGTDNRTLQQQELMAMENLVPFPAREAEDFYPGHVG